MVINTTWYCEGIDKKTSGGKKQAPTNILVYIYRMISYDRVGIFKKKVSRAFKKFNKL